MNQMTQDRAAMHERWRMRESDVVFMYGTSSPGLYDAYACNVVLWGGGGEAARIARAKGVHFQGAFWFLTAWGKNMAADPQLLQSVCVDIEGKPIEVSWLTDLKQELPNYWGCTNAPYYREYLRGRALAAIAGCDGIQIDDHAGTAACASSAGGCFCPHCIAGFREYLRSHCTAAGLAELGVGDVASFDYAQYVRQFASTRQEYTSRHWQIPLFLSYMNFQARAEAELVGKMRAVCEAAEGRRISVSANCCLPNAIQMADYQHLDTICGETEVHASGGRPSTGSHLSYQVATALRRPYAATASGWDWAWIAEHKKPGLVRTWIAESYAFGQHFMAPHNQWCYTAEKGSHYWQGRTEDFGPLYQWIRARGTLLDGFVAITDTVLVVNSPALYRGKDPSLQAAAYLGAHSAQYRLALAGGDWVDERLSAQDLLSARQVVVGSEDWLDGEQLAALQAVRVASKLVKWTGPESLSGRLTGSVRVEGALDVWALVRCHPRTGQVAVHLLNRNYSLEQDCTLPTGPVRVVISRELLGMSTFLSDGQLWQAAEAEPQALVIRDESGYVAFDVPTLDLWGIAVLSPKQRGLEV